LAAWLRCAELRAAEIPARLFNKGRLQRALGDLRTLSVKEPAESLPRLQQVLAESGVVLILLPCFSIAGPHGATFWLGSGKAVILLNHEGKWTDACWPGLFQAIGHILLCPKKTFIDADSTQADACFTRAYQR
jgi:hypothetical protein